MEISLNDERRSEFLNALQALFAEEFDETLSEFRADAILNLFLNTLGPAVYNQAVQDVRNHLQTKLDDLDGEVYVDGEAL